MPDVWTAVIGGVSGLGTGIVGSIFAPWANWRAEKQRLERQRKIDLLDSWRAGIAAMPIDESQTEVLITPWYETLRPYMSEDARTRLEKPRTFIVPHDSRGVRDSFTSEVDRIEREWGLRAKR
jgi:hypothetical protein